MSTMVQLKATATKLVARESDLDDESETLSLLVPGTIFLKAVALAEATNPAFRAPNRQFFAAHCREFVRGLSLAAQQEVAPPTRPSRQTALHQLQEFFHVPLHKRWLERLMKFMAESKGFTVEH